jgi:hypothetical protein
MRIKGSSKHLPPRDHCSRRESTPRLERIALGSINRAGFSLDDVKALSFATASEAVAYAQWLAFEVEDG